jgi:hypothetical protein
MAEQEIGEFASEDGAEPATGAARSGAEDLDFHSIQLAVVGDQQPVEDSPKEPWEVAVADQASPDRRADQSDLPEASS